MSVEFGAKAHIENPNIEVLFEPIDIRETLERIPIFLFVLNSLSEMGYKTRDGFLLDASGGTLGWRRIDSASGLGETVLHGWTAYDETLQYTADLIASGKSYKFPVSTRFEFHGHFPISATVSSRNSLNPDSHLIVNIINKNDELEIIQIQDQSGAFKTRVRYYKRSMGTKRFIGFHLTDNEWKKVEIGQVSMIDLNIYEPLDKARELVHDISQALMANNSKELVSSLIGMAIKTITTAGFRINKPFSDDELREFKVDILRGVLTSHELVNLILQRSSLSEKDRQKIKTALEANSTNVFTPMGGVVAISEIRKGSIRGNPTRILLPKTNINGQIRGFDRHWRAISVDYFSRKSELIVLENTLARRAIDHLPGIKSLNLNRVSFGEIT